MFCAGVAAATAVGGGVVIVAVVVVGVECVVVECEVGLMQDDKTAWVQLTVRIPSEQSFAAYDSQKNLVAGDPVKPVKVYDTWVFERALKKDPSSR